MKLALESKLTQEEFNAQLSNMQRDMDMKDIETKIQQSKLKQMKEENVTIRMQLLDPSNIKRGVMQTQSQRNNPEAINGKVVEEFVRVQSNYDAVMLQEELKAMIIEITLLKEKISEQQERFKKVDVSRETYITRLQDQVTHKRQQELKLLADKTVDAKVKDRVKDLEEQLLKMTV